MLELSRAEAKPKTLDANKLKFKKNSAHDLWFGLVSLVLKIWSVKHKMVWHIKEYKFLGLIYRLYFNKPEPQCI